MIWLFIYFVFAVVFMINLIMNILVLEYVRQAVSVRERPKLIEKINELKDLRKFCIVWPYILYRVLNKR
jgi:hypothetical protein